VIYEDALGNPISAGDKIVYATAQGSSSPELQRAIVENVDPVVKDPITGEKKYEGQKKPRYGGYSVNYPMRKQFFGPAWHNYKLVDHPPWMYRLQVRRCNDDWSFDGDRLTTIHNVDRVIVITRLV